MNLAYQYFITTLCIDLAGQNTQLGGGLNLNTGGGVLGMNQNKLGTSLGLGATGTGLGSGMGGTMTGNLTLKM